MGTDAFDEEGRALGRLCREAAPRSSHRCVEDRLAGAVLVRMLPHPAECFPAFKLLFPLATAVTLRPVVHDRAQIDQLGRLVVPLLHYFLDERLAQPRAFQPQSDVRRHGVQRGKGACTVNAEPPDQCRRSFTCAGGAVSFRVATWTRASSPSVRAVTTASTS